MQNESDKFDVLAERGRIRGASRIIPEGMDSSAVTPEQIAAVIENTSRFITERHISREQLGRAIGLSGSAVGDVLAGRYKSDPRGIVIQLDAWLEQECKRQDSPNTTEFVWTSVAQEMQVVASLACELNTIGLVYGPETSGIGKTMALQAIHAETPGSVFVTLSKAHASPTGLLRAIYAAIFGLKGSKFLQRNDVVYDRIIEKLRDTNRLLIIDQIHNLRNTRRDIPLYLLADIFDDTNHAPQLWCGTADLSAYLNRGSKKMDESLAQIRGRIGIERDLMQRTRPTDQGGADQPLFTIEQVRQMFATNKVRISPDGIRFIWKLACLPDMGALRLCRNVVRIATLIAVHQGAESISASLLWQSLRDCVQSSTYATINAAMDEDRPKTRLAAG